MKQKNLFGLTIFFFFCMQISGMELVIYTPCPLYLPHDVIQTIAEYLDLKRMKNFKGVCTDFNAASDYWMIDPVTIQYENIDVCSNGLIYFAHAHANASNTLNEYQQQKNFVHLLKNSSKKREKSLQLLGWHTNLSTKESIDAYRGVCAERAKPYNLSNALINNVAFKILCSSINPNIQDKQGYTILRYACENGDEKKVELLLNNPATDPNVQSEQGSGSTPLSLICCRNNKTIAKLLLSNTKINPNIFDRQGFNPLFWTIVNEDTSLTTLLLEHREIDPNVQNESGSTPLHFAIKNEEIIDLLLSHQNINPNIQDNSGETPLDKAYNKKIIELLRNKGARHSWNYYKMHLTVGVGVSALALVYVYNKK